MSTATYIGQVPGIETTACCPALPCMEAAELECFRRWVPFRGLALEFGSGGSTRYFCENGMGVLFSVESDPEWHALINGDPAIRFFVKRNRLISLCPDIGPCVRHGWGNPQGPARPEWLRYHQDVWRLLDPYSPDVVLVDGRFRVACVCQALLRCKPDAAILVHDFAERPHYHDVLAFTDVVDSAESMVVLKRKKRVNWKKLALLLQRTQFDPA